MITIQEIMNLLPHRYPFLMVDRIVEMVPGKSIVGLKNVTINEPFFTGHFPGIPIMPGVLIVEALAQTGGIFALLALGGEKKLAYFAAIDNCRFRRPVVPGDQLILNVTITAHKGPVWKMHGEARVGDALVAEADLTATIRDAFAEKAQEGAAK
ncbi:MAG: 3-hydroxyacyl-ACP dehydratase FabZ [Deltaproteobacteria bacterium]|nr:3-hydroxyacyl-ACP dehydratase FabZ [Deltaproteobacteria bacterium]